MEFRLPAGSAAMETGGYKGRSREVAKQELHLAISSRLGIVPERILLRIWHVRIEFAGV